MASPFYKYFKKNMDELGLPAPASLYESAITAIGTAKICTKLLKDFGTRVTVREAIGATVGFEKLEMIGTLGLAYYTGAVIGSICIAIQRTVTGGTTIADIIWVATKKGINPPGLRSTLVRHPRILPQGRGSKNFSGPR